MRRAAAALAVLTLLAACTDDEPGKEASTTSTERAADDTTTSTEAPAEGTLDDVDLAAREVGTLDAPTALASRPGSSDLYIAEKGGRVRLIKAQEDEVGKQPGRITYQVQSTPLLDISDRVIDDGERGLLGIAFSSDGRRVYLDYTRQPDGATVVAEYTLGDSPRIDKGSRRELLMVEQPFPNHNGGQLVTGPDGYLYVGLGDGGNGGDPFGHGQNTSTLLGSILRIDPESSTDDREYGIPDGNPFADGEHGAPEVWLYGTRNPWRFSFDSDTGDLWVADVGQDAYEEIDLLPAQDGFDAGRGDNLGWAEMEGKHPFKGGKNPAGAVLPIFEYGRDDGCSVVGGFVYRGDDIPGLQGTYLYDDYCGTGVRGLQVDGEEVIDTRTWDLPIEDPYSLGQDDAGELYVLLASGPVLKLVPPATGEGD
ncbi:MAG: PQQ-dependent sugar dehydrogenase [Acidimicrobiales bacterium]